MHKLTEKKQDGTNYNFTLACLAGLATAAVVALCVAAKSIAALAATKGLVMATLTTSTIATGSVLPIIGLALFIGCLCFLLSGGYSSGAYTERQSSSYGRDLSFWSSTATNGGAFSRNQHSHPSTYSGYPTNYAPTHDRNNHHSHPSSYHPTPSQPHAHHRR